MRRPTRQRIGQWTPLRSGLQSDLVREDMQLQRTRHLSKEFLDLLPKGRSPLIPHRSAFC